MGYFSDDLLKIKLLTQIYRCAPPEKIFLRKHCLGSNLSLIKNLVLKRFKSFDDNSGLYKPMTYFVRLLIGDLY